MEKYKKVLDFWFPSINIEYKDFWFNSTPEIDQFIRNNFYDLLLELEKSDNITYQNADELLTKIIILDQFSRHIYRGTKKSFKNDNKALKLAKIYFEEKFNDRHALNRIIFALMPFRHSVNLEDQQFVVDKFDEIKNNSELWNKFRNELS